MCVFKNVVSLFAVRLFFSLCAAQRLTLKPEKEWHGEHAIKWTRSGSQT